MSSHGIEVNAALLQVLIQAMEVIMIASRKAKEHRPGKVT